MKKVIIFIFVFSLATQMIASNVLNLHTGQLSTHDYVDPVCYYNNYEDSIIITHEFSSAKIIYDDLYLGTIWWHIDGFGLNDISTEASLPVKLETYVIPNGYNAIVTIIDTAYIDFNYELTPARPPLIDSGNEYYTKDNVPEISIYDGFEPLNVVNADEIQTYRNNNVQYVRIYPIQYDCINKRVRAYTCIKYKITYLKDNNMTLKNVNRNIINVNLNDITDTINIDYLIISNYKYSKAIVKFAEWKKLLGFNVHIRLKDYWTVNAIKDTVLNIYKNYPNLEYLLIIGDQEDVPSCTSTTNNTHVTDLYYGCMDGKNDYTPDIYRGRLPVSNLEEANIVIDKIIKYEKNPPRNNSFYISGLNCAFFQDGDSENQPDSYADRRFAQTSEDIKTYLESQGKLIERVYYTNPNVIPLYWNRDLYSIGESIPEELKKPNFAWDGNYTDIINAINNGCFYVLHRDHGSYDCWGKPYFSKLHIEQLSNGELLPIVFSLNCLTGKFDYPNEDCFVETFLSKNNGGCVGIYGATSLSYSGYNDALAVGMFDAIWPYPGLRPLIGYTAPIGGQTPTPTYRLGQILDQGLVRMAETYGASSSFYSKYQAEIFHCFGDPSMRIYTNQPSNFLDVSVNRSESEISVDLKGEIANIIFYNHSNDNSICLRGDSVKVKTSEQEYFSVCIVEHNKIPFIDYGEKTTKLNIQNISINSNSYYDSDVINIGTNVTDFIPNGDVSIKESKVEMSASKYIIEPNTIISSESEILLKIK